jgi:stage III sporulation protein AC
MYDGHRLCHAAASFAVENMPVNLLFKIAAVGILVTLLNQVLKQSGRDEEAFFMTLGGLLVVLFWIVPYLLELFEMMEQLFQL